MNAKTEVAQAEWVRGVDLDGAERHEKAVGHGRADSKGRMIGGLAVIVPGAAGRFLCSVQSTRNGKDFGATDKYSGFATIEEAKAYADARVIASIKRTLTKKEKAPTQARPSDKCARCGKRESEHFARNGSIAKVCRNLNSCTSTFLPR